jgi:DNA-binding SARP family transcriptional activator
MRSLLGRWDHRVTSLTGGPGLGKTTLLAQAIAENRLSPRGEDMWIGIEPHDADADRLARVVRGAISGNGNGNGNASAADDAQTGLDPASVADSVWTRSPTQTCLMLDDVHLLPSGSSGAAWLTALVDALPANGHVVLASRSDPPVPLTRIGAQGALLRLAEDDLRFSDEELSGFAQRRGLDPQHFGDTGGWPAMAELTASVERRFTGEYLWEQVLEPLGTVRRHVLAVVCDLGGADDALASAAVGTPVELTRALDGVPLVARGFDGWHVPHAMWRTAPGIALFPGERAEIRRRAIDHLNARGRYDEAFSLAQEAELWDAAPGVLRAACLASDRLVSSQLGRWLAASPDPVRASLGGQLAEGMHIALTTPRDAIPVMQEVAAQCEAAGDVDAELTAIAKLGQLAWWRQDLTIMASVGGRVTELEAAGHPTAKSLATFGRALVADMAGDTAGAIAHLDRLESSSLDPTWEAFAWWLRGALHIDLGDPESAYEIGARFAAKADPAVKYMFDTLKLQARWAQGRLDEVVEATPGVMASGIATGVTANLYIGISMASLVYSHTGDVVSARRCVDQAATVMSAAATSRAGRTVMGGICSAALLLAEGDEAAATATLRDAIGRNGLDQGINRRTWRQMLGLTYVLVPESRAHWDAAELQGHMRSALELAQVVVALREGRGLDRLRTLDVGDLSAVRFALHFRFAAELAVGLASVGRSEGRALLDALGPPGRAAVRDLAVGSESARPAKALLAAVPAPPPRTTYLAVLGPMSLRRDGVAGDEVVDPDLRRKRLQALLAYLVGHRRTNRTAIVGAVWPDLDEQSAGKNLAVTLTYLLRVLEPWRTSGDPPYLVRLDGPMVELVTGEHLRIDVDEFDQHLAAAAQAEADGTPSLALEHNLAAVALYRDDLYLDVVDADWFSLDREHYRMRFVATATRAGHLLLGRGDAEKAQSLAYRVLAVDQWSEEAYAVLIGAALARGDRSGARRLLARCLDVLEDLGADPSEATQQLSRRVGATVPSR